ncbi:hypothetical protein [Amycolatopsis plumensis]|uniref:hypothetical protein n=1 Tax=Amycolatopsis plumensis TaxID=236508 RepID=UPI0036178635
MRTVLFSVMPRTVGVTSDKTTAAAREFTARRSVFRLCDNRISVRRAAKAAKLLRAAKALRGFLNGISNIDLEMSGGRC